MTYAIATRALLAWCSILLLAIVNGAAREALLLPRLGHSGGLFLSGIVLSALVLIVARIVVPWIRPASASGAWSVGALWVGLTLAFEFGFGGLIQHKTWLEMLQPYAFQNGNMWPVVLAVTLVAPRVSYAASRRQA